MCSLTVLPCIFLQVINAARTLAARPRSKAALDNMDVFKVQWEGGVRLLTEAVDDITTIEYFLAVSGMFGCPEAVLTGKGVVRPDITACMLESCLSDWIQKGL